MKKTLEIKALPKVKEVNNSLDFLNDSVQKRNLSALGMLKEFFLELEKNYQIYGGLSVLLKYNILRINSDIIESLLFCSMKQIAPTLKKKNPTEARFYLDFAKKNFLLHEEVSNEVNDIFDLRNDFHPRKQKEIHVWKKNKLLMDSEAVVLDVVANLRAYFKSGVRFGIHKNQRCPYCEYDYTREGEICDFCYKLKESDDVVMDVS